MMQMNKIWQFLLENAKQLLKKGAHHAARLGRLMLKHRAVTVAVSCCLILSMLMSVITVTINRIDVYDEEEKVLSYYAIDTASESILEKAGLTLEAGDEIIRSEDGGLITLKVERAFPVYVVADGKTEQVLMIQGTVADALEKAKITCGEDDLLSRDLTESVAEGMKINLDRVTGEQITVTESIDFETEKVKTNKLFVGETKVKQEGQEGTREKVYAVTYINGEETERELISSEVIEEPVNKIVLVGTKEKPVVKTGSFKSTSSAPSSYKKVYQMTCTAYSAGGTTATGRPAKWGVIAVDPRVIPLGSKVYVETVDGKFIYGTAIAADTGGAIKGNIIDICVNSRSEAYAFGRRQVYVYVL